MFAVLAVFRWKLDGDFVSTSSLTFDTKGFGQRGDFEPVVRTAVQSVTSEESVAKILAQLGDQPGATALRVDAVRLASRLRISLTDQPSPVLSISLTGSGTAAEREFVNRLAQHLAVESTRQHDRSKVALWLEDFNSTLDVSKQVHLAKQIRDELQQAGMQIAQCRIAMDSPDDAVSVQDRIRRLEGTLAELKSKFGYPDTAPDIMQLRNQIEQLRALDAAMDVPKPSARGDVFLAPTTAVNSQTNPYYQASEKRLATEHDAAAAIAKRSELLDTIDLQVAQMASDQLLANAESSLDSRRDLVDNLSGYFANPSIVSNSMVSVQTASRSTLCGGRAAFPMTTAIFSCLIAALTAYYYDPLRHRMQLRSLSDVVKAVRADVIGQLPTGPTVSRPKRPAQLASYVVRISEIVACVVLGIVLLVCLVKPWVASTLLQDPWYGLSHWCSLILRT